MKQPCRFFTLFRQSSASNLFRIESEKVIVKLAVMLYNSVGNVKIGQCVRFGFGVRFRKNFVACPRAQTMLFFEVVNCERKRSGK